MNAAIRNQEGGSLEASGPHNRLLIPGIDSARGLGRLGHHLLRATLAPSRASMHLMQVMAEKVGMPVLTAAGRIPDALFEISDQLTREPATPQFDLKSAMIDGKEVPVSVENLWDDPFGTLVHFRREFTEGEERRDPKVLIVAPLSGHYATLQQPTIEGFIANADVHISFWKDARQVPKSFGKFGLDEYTDYVRKMIETIGPDTHVIAICQSTVPTTAALALMHEEAPATMPASLTLISGPMDTNVGTEGNKVNELSQKYNTRQISQRVIGRVPPWEKGHGRDIYPGMMQLSAFYMLDPWSHIKAHAHQFWERVIGDDASANRRAEFYREYNSILSMDQAFYLTTFERVFRNADLANGQYHYRGELVHPERISDLPLMTIGGGKDAMCPPIQTHAAHDIFSGLPAELRRSFTEEQSGHYGTWAGSRFLLHIAPRMRQLWIDAAARKGIEPYSPPTLTTIAA